MKHTFLGLVISLAFSSSFCFAQSCDHPGKITDDSALVAAVNNHRRVNYVEAGNLVVTQLLPDDTNGLPHQKWQAQLSSGDTITVVYNTDMGSRVPLQVGDRFGVGGQFVPAGRSGIIHWLHDDPKHMRCDGYVYFNGVVYGDTDGEAHSSSSCD